MRGTKLETSMNDHDQQQQAAKPQYRSDNKFDRALGALDGIPDVIHTAPTTVRSVTPMIGAAQTFIVQTFRQRESGDTVFLEYVDEGGTVRIVVPPAVTKVIARQRDSLTDRARSKAAKAVAEDRKARGIKPAFMKTKKK
jgi:hypothetical protein